MPDTLPKHDPPTNATEVAESDIGLRNAMGVRHFTNDDISEGNSTNGATTASQGNYTVQDGYIAEDDYIQVEDTVGHVWHVQAVADDEFSVAEATRRDGGTAIANYVALLAAGLWGFRHEKRLIGQADIITDTDDGGFSGSDINVSSSDVTKISAAVSTNASGISLNDTDIADHEARLAGLEQGDMDSGSSSGVGAGDPYGYLDDSSKNWTADQWIGFYLIDSDGDTFEIMDNTTTRLEWNSETSPTAGAYKIRRQAYIVDNSLVQAKLVDGTLDLTSAKMAATSKFETAQMTVLTKVTDGSTSPADQYDFQHFTEFSSIVGEVQTARGGYSSLGNRMDQISSPTGGLISHLHGNETLGSEGGAMPHWLCGYMETATYSTGVTYILAEIALPGNVTGIRLFSMEFRSMATPDRTNVFGIRSENTQTNLETLTLSTAAQQYSTTKVPASDWIAKFEGSNIQVYITIGGGGNETDLFGNWTIGYYLSNYDFPSPS